MILRKHPGTWNNTAEKGYQVAVAQDGTDCLTMLESLKPDLILLDIMMPTMDGYEVLRQ